MRRPPPSSPDPVVRITVPVAGSQGKQPDCQRQVFTCPGCTMCAEYSSFMTVMAETRMIRAGATEALAAQRG